MEEDRSYLDGDRMRHRTFARASALPLFPPVKAAMEAVETILRREFITGAEARERVRVEITHKVKTEFRLHVSVNDLGLVHDPKSVGPMVVMGVSFYVVPNLPDPGWRVRGVRPLEERQ